jgi:hypothetical protein
MAGWRKYEVGEYSASEILQRNEQLKALGGICRTAGLSLLIAGSARWFGGHLDFHSIFWLIVGLGGIGIGIGLLTLLEAEG